MEWTQRWTTDADLHARRDSAATDDHLPSASVAWRALVLATVAPALAGGCARREPPPVVAPTVAQARAAGTTRGEPHFEVTPGAGATSERPAPATPGDLLLDDALRKKLGSGLLVHLKLTDGSVVHTCIIHFDLWDEVFRLAGPQPLTAANLESAVRLCWGGPMDSPGLTVREIP
jgi:hypothetical protein